MLQRDAVTRFLGPETTHARILDVASGTGQMLPALATVADCVVASDLTPAMLAVARNELRVAARDRLLRFGCDKAAVYPTVLSMR